MNSEANTPPTDERNPMQAVMQAVGGIELSAGVYMMLTILSGGVVALRVVDLGTNWLLLILAVLLAAMLFFRIWLIGMMYLAVLVFLNQTEARYLEPGATPLDFSEVVFAAGCLGFVIFASRYIAMMSPIRTFGAARSTWRESVQFLKGLLKPLDEASVEKRVFDHGCQLGRRQRQIMKLDELFSSGIRVVIGVGLAVGILQYVPLLQEYVSRNEFGLKGPVVRIIMVGWLILTALIVLRFVTGPVRRSQSRREAELFLRSEATRGLFSELRAMITRLVKHRQKTFVRRLADPVRKNSRAEPTALKMPPAKRGADKGRKGGSEAQSSAPRGQVAGHSASELKKRFKRTR